MTMLRKGAKGSDVRSLQEGLSNHGVSVLRDGLYGEQTELAVRAFQRRQGLLPDGIAGPKTMRELGIASSSAQRATHSRETILRLGGAVFHSSESAKNLPLVTDFSRPSLSRQISEKGMRFIFTHEALAGVSNRLHWPGGASGVTLGPGYDMKERASASILADMGAIGLDITTSTRISEAAGLQGAAAREYAIQNKSLVSLTAQQETSLLAHVIKRYASAVKQMLMVDVLQHELDALVSFAYNPGGRLRTVMHHINSGHVAEAMFAMKQSVTSNGLVMKGLVRRRDDEVALYLYGSYGGAQR